MGGLLGKEVTDEFGAAVAPDRRSASELRS
jgi:hypothetical protein